MDELRGRKIANHHFIQVVGVLGLLMQSKRQRLVQEIAPLIQQLQDVDYRLSSKLVNSVLERMGESKIS
jgi:predicted nucleic acid-binding protein